MSQRADIRLAGITIENLYFKLLPKDLYDLLSIYYYGLMEIKIDSISKKFFRHGTEWTNLLITIFASDGKSKTNTLHMGFYIRKLVKNRFESKFVLRENDHNNNLEISHKSTPPTMEIINRGFAITSTLFLNTYYTNLFYDKLESITRLIDELRDKNVNILQMLYILPRMTF